jgi:hypothetical protein
MRTNAHEHDLDPEFLDPIDAIVLAIFEDDGGLAIRFGIPCPECGESVEAVANVTEIEASDLELPLDDVEEVYD